MSEESNIIQPGMNPMMFQQQMQERGKKMIANEFETQQYPKDELGEDFEVLKYAVLKFATPLSMQCTIEQFALRKKKLSEKSKHHAYTLAEVASVANSFENSASEQAVGGQENWNALAKICIPLSNKCQQLMHKISQEVMEKLKSGIVNQQGVPMVGTKTGKA